MTQNEAERLLELEESANGTDLYRVPGDDLQAESERDQAEASGWIPEPEGPEHPTSRLERARHRRLQLHEAMEDLESTTARASGADDWLGAVDAALVALGKALEAHIGEVETPAGLLTEIIDKAPRLSPDVRLMRDDHEELRTAWGRTLAALRQQQPPSATMVRRRVTALLGRLTQHRQRGADLVYEAYNVDIGAGD